MAINTTGFALPKPGVGKVVLTSQQLSKKKQERWNQGERTCHICRDPIRCIQDAELDHIEPEPAGCKKNSADDNLAMSHIRCNRFKGSKRLPKEK